MLRPRLRDGLRFRIHEQGGRRVCVIEDPHRCRFHRVGLEEFRFLRALDGSRPVAAILAEQAREHSSAAFTEHEAVQMLRWCKDQDLLAIEGARAVVVVVDEPLRGGRDLATARDRIGEQRVGLGEGVLVRGQALEQGVVAIRRPQHVTAGERRRMRLELRETEQFGA